MVSPRGSCGTSSLRHSSGHRETRSARYTSSRPPRAATNKRITTVRQGATAFTSSRATAGIDPVPQQERGKHMPVVTRTRSGVRVKAHAKEAVYVANEVIRLLFELAAL